MPELPEVEVTRRGLARALAGRRVSADDRKLARDAILQSFYALRETFLEELDLEAPDNPLLIHNGRRMKKPGAPGWARRRQSGQHRYQDRVAPADPAITPFLTTLYDKEQTTAKPWREVIKKPAAATEARPPTAARVRRCPA